MQLAVACIVLAITWLMLRRQAGGGSLRMLALDVAPILIGWLALAAVLRRPIAASVLIMAAGAGLAVTDVVKRATLREPLVFADRAELLEVIRHPGLYLPFAGPVRIIGGALAAIAAAAALIRLEPPSFHLSPIEPVALAMAGFVVPVWGPILPRLAAFYRRLGISGDPEVDMRRHGFLACLAMQSTVARDERPKRRAAVPPFASSARASGPVVLLQIESFFDARRLGNAVPSDLLHAWDRLRGGALQAGRLSVPCWGANTVRSEFAALTGIGAQTLGLDRFNPYERFAQSRIRSVAWQMKAAGYRTICLHPFDKRFYARHRVMRQLGFDEFRGLEAFRDADRTGSYVSDVAVAAEIARIVREEGPRVFVFAMTMGNHGPWPAAGLAEDGAAEPWNPELQAYVAGLRISDRMLGTVMDAIPPDGLLAVYGDHQPSLAAFAALNQFDERTDYAIWRPGAHAGAPSDIAVEDLPDLLLRLQSA